MRMQALQAKCFVLLRGSSGLIGNECGANFGGLGPKNFLSGSVQLLKEDTELLPQEIQRTGVG